MSISSFFHTTLPTWWSPAGLIEITPLHAWVFRWWYVGLIALCLIVAVASSFLRLRQSLRVRIQNLAWTNVFIGVVLYFSRDQQLPYLGMDILRLLQEVCLVVWINATIWFYRTSYQKELVHEKVSARREKYLPKSRA